MAKLKVFRTPAGFHDAYVAAPSQKAALAAWGSDANLFARGLAEQVTDPELMREPLAHPGDVIRVARTMADALPTATKVSRRKATPTPAPKPAPRPNRTALDKAEAALEAAEARQAEERAALKREEQTLAARRRALDKMQAEERTRLDKARIKARDEYEAAVERWRDD
ncbi:hypothetical protein [Sphingomonas jeddahensis]|uniref:Cell envelope biogenesis protein TolA n=1 Tax=Sphingomonas jeddahensis TaxID=1915074 RepID=A0A1V2EVX4_9SPHN|nr:hypothetical protein [Sphingomonas jeddahensis]ONF96831.1 hypothetical protein SPHI_10250 [Sphingomonas jeddahensis]